MPSITRNIVAKGSLEIFNTLLPFILVPYVYRTLGKDAMGNIEYTTTLFTYFSILGFLGIYNYGLRAISSNRKKPDFIKKTFNNLFVVGLISNTIAICLYILFLLFVINNPTIKTIGLIYAGNLVAQMFYVEWVNEGLEEFGFITIKTIIIRLLNAIAIFVLVKNEENGQIYVAIITLTLLANNLVSFMYAIRKIHWHITDIFKSLNIRQYIIPLLIILVLRNTGILYTIADRTFLGYFKGTETVAIFSIGQKIVEIAKTLVLSVVFATLPRLALYLKENKALYIANLHKLIRIMIAMLLPVGTGLFLLSPQIIYVIGGAQYAEAIPSMRIFSLRIICLGIESILYNQVLFLHEREKIIVKYNLLCGGVNVLLNLAFLHLLTPTTAILFTLFSEILFEYLCFRYIVNKLNITLNIFSRYNLRYVLLCLLFIPIVWSINSLCHHPILSLVYSSILCMILYLSFLMLIKDEAIMEIINRLKK